MAVHSVKLFTFSSGALSRQLVLRVGPVYQLTISRSTTTSSAGESFFDRNKRLSRPLSPHVAILVKNPQVPAMLSIAHRITGVVMTFDVWAVTIAWLASGKTFPQFIESVQALSIHPTLLMAGKFCFAFPFTYHFCNAFRHFYWDMGKGFEIPTIYKSGFFVLTVAILSAIGLTMYTPSL